MKLALAGTGQMGQAVAELAPQRGHEIVATFNSGHPLVEVSGPAALNGAEAVIDFSLPNLALDHIDRYCEWQLPAVVGTTGWYEELDTVRKWVDTREATLLYAPNFSLGVAILVRALRGALPLLDQVTEYDAFVHEMHHTKKVDSPSGTARMLGEEILSGLARKKRLEPEAQHDRIDTKALHVSSTRAGSIFGEHAVGFDSPFDQIRFTHEAKNRQGFAFGALRAAEWLPGRVGLFTLEEVLADWLA